METDTVKPLVSIIVPSFNQGDFIARTLESIFSQDYRPIEVLVIDGGSKDQTVEILEQFSARFSELFWLSEPDKGVADAVNKGLARAKGKYAAIQSSDDLYRSGAISEAVAVLNHRPELAFVSGEIEIIDQDDQIIRLAPDRQAIGLRSVLARTSIVHQSSTFFRLNLAQQLQGWNSSYFCCDTELWLRMLMRQPALRISRVWSAWRQHDAQRDQESRKMLECWESFTKHPEIAGKKSLIRAARAGVNILAFQYEMYSSNAERRALAWGAIRNYFKAYTAIRPRSLLIPGLGRLFPKFINFEDRSHLPKD